PSVLTLQLQALTILWCWVHYSLRNMYNRPFRSCKGTLCDFNSKTSFMTSIVAGSCSLVRQCSTYNYKLSRFCGAAFILASGIRTIDHSAVAKVHCVTLPPKLLPGHQLNQAFVAGPSVLNLQLQAL